MKTETKFAATALLFKLVFVVYTIFAYIYNIILLLGSDFQSPWKEEFLYGLGVVFPPVSWFTIWI